MRLIWRKLFPLNKVYNTIAQSVVGSRAYLVKVIRNGRLDMATFVIRIKRRRTTLFTDRIPLAPVPEAAGEI
jgi:hypothetical protein